MPSRLIVDSPSGFVPRLAVGCWAIACLLLSACSAPVDPSAQAYVVVDPSKTEDFLQDLGEISKAHGLVPSRGSATSNEHTFYVLEAGGKLLRLWAQNAPMSGEECVPHLPEPMPDPGQFTFNVMPTIWLASSSSLRTRAKNVFDAVTAELRARGYRVRSEHTSPCGRVDPWKAATDAA
jgi:hypothetical protein